MAMGPIRLPWARDGRRRRAALVLVVAPALIVLARGLRRR